MAALFYNISRRRRHRVLIVHTYHGHVLEGYFSPLVSRAVRFVERSLASITDRIVTISETQKLDIVDRFGISPCRKTSIVPLGLDLETLLAMSAPDADHRTALGFGPADLVVAFVGRMVPVKDLPTLVRGFALALRALPHLRLLLAGDGPVRKDVETLARELLVWDKVHMHGWVEDLPRLYAAVDIFALSSINEGTPVALIEAMAAGKAVVATAVGGVPDVVDDSLTGVLIPPRSPEALAEAVVGLAADPGRRARLGEAARISVRERYSLEHLVNNVESLYRLGLSFKRAS